MHPVSRTLWLKILEHIAVIYPDHDAEMLAHDLIHAFWPDDKETGSPHHEPWSEESHVVITYGDSIKSGGQSPLKDLHDFLNTELKDQISAVHILPFFPFSSDDGFSVMDYDAVRPDLGTWDDIKTLSQDYEIMGDLVINHASAQGKWFKAFANGDETYQDFFYTAPKDSDVSMVTRPRTSPLLVPFDIDGVEKHLWCTFGPDQVDLNFENTEVLMAFLRIIRHYLRHDITIFRLDAVAFLWKKLGTNSIHLPQTHEVIKLLRTLLDHDEADAILITETNVPNHENLSYFGNGDEAHMVYNFSLPPLLVYSLLAGDTQYLSNWLKSMPQAEENRTFFNFVASHDGIGIRPANGLLKDEERNLMIETIKKFGGDVSMRTADDGSEHPYEMNVALFDALRGTMKGEDGYQVQRFLASQMVMMALQGVPAFYIHSLLATPNDTALYAETGRKRSLNRHQWDLQDLKTKLANPETAQAQVLKALKQAIDVRKKQSAFHPNAPQSVLDLPEGLFGVKRCCKSEKQHIYAITNMTDQPQEMSLSDIVDTDLTDLFSGQMVKGNLSVAPYQSFWLSSEKSP